MKFPLDTQTFVENVHQIVEHDKAQTMLVDKMGSLLQEVLGSVEKADEFAWHSDVESIVKELQSLKLYHDNRRFNESNGHFEAPGKPVATKYGSMGGVGMAQLPSDGDSEGEMSEEELAKLFKERREPSARKVPEKPLNKMTLQEIEDWESKQDNSNDIYKIKARVANLARGPGMSLTPQGEMLCNSFVHVLKAFYDFSETMTDKESKIKLISLIRAQEGMPGTLIAAAGAGVKASKKDVEGL